MGLAFVEAFISLILGVRQYLSETELLLLFHDICERVLTRVQKCILLILLWLGFIFLVLYFFEDGRIEDEIQPCVVVLELIFYQGMRLAQIEDILTDLVVEDQVTLVNEGLGMIKVVLLFFVSPIHVDNKDAVILGIKQNLKVF